MSVFRKAFEGGNINSPNINQKPNAHKLFSLYNKNQCRLYSTTIICTLQGKGEFLSMTSNTCMYTLYNKMLYIL